MNAPSISTGAPWASLLDGEARTWLEREALLPFIVRQRWFAGKARRATAAAVSDWGVLSSGDEPSFLCLVAITYADGGHDRYVLPVATSGAATTRRIERERPASVIARLSGTRQGALHDVLEDRVASVLLEAIAGRRTIPMRAGEIRALPTSVFAQAHGPAEAGPLKVRRPSGEQSNTSLLYADRLILKILRRVEPGLNPDYEIGLHLTERTAFEGAPRLAGALEYWSGGEPTTIGVMHELIGHERNAWDDALAHARRFFDDAHSRRAPSAEVIASRGSLLAAARLGVPALARDTMAGYADRAALLGRRTAELHAALAWSAGNPAFEPEPLTAAGCRSLAADMRGRSLAAIASLEASLDQLPARVAEPARRVVSTPAPLVSAFDELAGLSPSVSQIRVHGDYHLGQVLCTRADVVIVDFEGEPLRSVPDRRRKQPAMKDLAGMLRSFSYAAHAALLAHTGDRPDEMTHLEPWAALWQEWASAAFLRAYLQTAGAAAFVPRDPAPLDILLRAFLLDKAFYELDYELGARPDWLRIPLLGILSIGA